MKLFNFELLFHKKITMNLRYKYFGIFAVLVLLHFSCDDSSQLTENEIPQIIGISKQSTFNNDLLTIYGKFFGIPKDNAFLYFIKQSGEDTLLKLAAKDCIHWTSTEITFKVPSDISSCKILVQSNGKYSNKISILINSLPDLEMLEIPAGNFQMGSLYGFTNEKPVHQVSITKKFFVAKFEISQLLWENVMGYNNSVIKGNDLPAHNIDWLEAIRFCNAISKRMKYDTCYKIINDNIVKFDTNANGYRLPTEAEWEYVSRAGSNKDFAGKNADEVAWYNLNSGFSPHPSGTLSANTFGLYDMQGNVWEWCWDYYSNDYYQDSVMVNPLGPQTGSRRVLRGGSCSSGTAHIRASNRTYPEIDFRFCGIRLARTKYE